MAKQILNDLTYEEFLKLMQQLHQPIFRAKQLQEAINTYKSIDQISNLPKELKDQLSKDFIVQPLKIHTSLKGKDGTVKYVFSMHDNSLVEGVLMKYKYGYTLCVSTQVGCRMGCTFCASTLNGLIRNLTAGEILSQVLCVNSILDEGSQLRKITNIVLMGSGEPLDNYDNVIKFIKIISSKESLNISPRNISISTCGIVPKIYQLAEEGLPLTLTISLHAPNDELRKDLMPIAKTYGIVSFITAAKNYFEKTGRRVIFEYALTKGKNDSDKCVTELVELLKGFPAHINIIPLNSVKERDLLSPTRKQACAFAEKLKSYNLSATVRRTMGEDIEGACGQLRAKVIREEE